MLESVVDSKNPVILFKSELTAINRPKCPHCGHDIIIKTEYKPHIEIMIGGPPVTSYKHVIVAKYCSGCETLFHF